MAKLVSSFRSSIFRICVLIFISKIVSSVVSGDGKRIFGNGFNIPSGVGGGADAAVGLRFINKIGSSGVI